MGIRTSSGAHLTLPPLYLLLLLLRLLRTKPSHWVLRMEAGMREKVLKGTHAQFSSHQVPRQLQQVGNAEDVLKTFVLKLNELAYIARFHSQFANRTLFCLAMWTMIMHLFYLILPNHKQTQLAKAVPLLPVFLLAASHHGPHDSPAVQEAIALMLDAIYNFCANVSPMGVPLFTRLEGQVCGGGDQ